MTGHRPDQVEFSTRVVLACVVVGILVVVGLAADRVTSVRLAQAQQYPPLAQAPALKYLPKRGGQPDILVILKDAPAEWQLCAQRSDSDQMDCRPVYEARKWLRERPSVKR